MRGNFGEPMYEMLKNTAIDVLGVSDEDAANFAQVVVKNANKQLSGNLPEIMKLSRESELNKFIEHAIEQGTNMPFSAMERGVLAAGRMDMQNGLSEIADKLKIGKPSNGECDDTLENRGRSKKKILTAVGEIEVHPTRWACLDGAKQSAYPLLDFIGLIDHEVKINDSTIEIQTIKCTRDAAVSIALACAENSYETSLELLEHLAGWKLNAMTGFRITDSVGSEFVKETPETIDEFIISAVAENSSENILKTRIDEMKNCDNQEEVEEIIRKAIIDGPDGVSRSDYTGPTIKVMYVESDGSGVPGRRNELLGVKGRQPDGSAKTFEAKIGAVFTMEYTNDGRPLLTEKGEIYRDKQIKYTGTVRKVDDFGPLLFQHAVDNGLESADAVVFLGDGAKWVWNTQQKYFPNALTGVDLYHAIEKVGKIVDLLQFKGRNGTERKVQFKDECIDLLSHGKINEMLDKLNTQPRKNGMENKFDKSKDYFLNNVDRMNYGIFNALGIFVGSGVIEAGVKVIVGNRMKNAGMHWSKEQAEKMISLRCAIKNKEYYDTYIHNPKCNAV